MSSKVEYLNAEEVAIRSIAFSGKISQKSSAFFCLNDSKILDTASFGIKDCCET